MESLVGQQRKEGYRDLLEGGAKYTNKRGRKIPLRAWESLLKQDAIFVSLDYRDGINHKKIERYDTISKSPDYDDTAALIASLDAVVGVNTTAIHVANGLGYRPISLYLNTINGAMQGYLPVEQDGQDVPSR